MKTENKKGFVRSIVIIVVAVVILSFLNIDLIGMWRDYLQAPVAKVYSLLVQYVIDPVLRLVRSILNN
jgi:hypothetical protein